MSQPFNPANFLMMNLPLILPLFADPSVKNAFTEMMKTPEGQKKLKDGFLSHFKMFINETLASAGLPPVAIGGKKRRSVKKSAKKMSAGKKRRSAKKSAKKMSAGKKRRSVKKSPKKH
jgi:hypothetical protein